MAASSHGTGELIAAGEGRLDETTREGKVLAQLAAADEIRVAGAELARSA